MNGYVKLYRKLLENPMWKQLAPAVTKVAIYFLLRANYQPGSWYDGKEMIEVPAGSFVTSYGRIMDDCNLSMQQVRDAFTHLFRTHFSTYQRTPRWTMVSVVNWSAYQATDDVAEHTQEHTVDRARNKIGTTNKKERSKEVNTCASDDARLPGSDIRENESPAPESLWAPQDQDRPARTDRVKSRGAGTPEQEQWFTEWWAAYWLKRAKKDAHRAFLKHVKTSERFKQIMAAVRAQAPEILSRDAAKRPHGATWLNGERWADEIANPVSDIRQDDEYPEWRASA